MGFTVATGVVVVTIHGEGMVEVVSCERTKLLLVVVIGV